MNGASSVDLVVFAIASFAASLVAGLAGFAFGLVAAAVWLHILTPVQTTALIVAFGLLVQGFSVWQLRRALRLGRLLPFLVGGAIGVPIGAELLRWTSAAHLRMAVGFVLIAFSLYSLARPKLAKVTAGGRAADGAVGVLSGTLGSATGLGGILPTVWCGLRGRDTLRLFVIGLPAVLAGLWLGLKLYGRLDEAGFRKVVLALLLLSGVVLVV